MLLKPLAALRADCTTELRPSRNELVDPLFHQSKIPSRSFLSVLATLFISATAECIIHEPLSCNLLVDSGIQGLATDMLCPDAHLPTPTD